MKKKLPPRIWKRFSATPGKGRTASLRSIINISPIGYRSAFPPLKGNSDSDYTVIMNV